MKKILMAFMLFGMLTTCVFADSAAESENEKDKSDEDRSEEEAVPLPEKPWNITSTMEKAVAQNWLADRLEKFKEQKEDVEEIVQDWMENE